MFKSGLSSPSYPLSPLQSIPNATAKVSFWALHSDHIINKFLQRLITSDSTSLSLHLRHSAITTPLTSALNILLFSLCLLMALPLISPSCFLNLSPTLSFMPEVTLPPATGTLQVPLNLRLAKDTCTYFLLLALSFSDLAYLLSLSHVVE